MLACYGDLIAHNFFFSEREPGGGTFVATVIVAHI